MKESPRQRKRSEKRARRENVRPAIERGAAHPKGRRFSEAEKQRALQLIAGKMSRSEVAAAIGTSTESLRQWVKKAVAKGTFPDPLAADTRAEAKVAARGSAARVAPRAQSPVRAPQSPTSELPSLSAREAARSPYAPSDPGQGLGDHEVAAILELKKKHPSMGPAQLRAQLKRFKGWRLALRAIARVLRGHGYEPVHRGSKPKDLEVTRFEAPRRNALWQADFTEVRVGDERLHVLIILDDFSRFVVGFALADAPDSDVAVRTLRAAIARHGKPEAMRTDRGGAFVAFSKETHFGRFLEAELIDHIVGRSYRPRGGGKVESAVGTLKRELWEVFHFEDRAEAEDRLADFFEEYNERRAHMGIDGLTPADRFFGRADRVLAAIDAVSRKRQGALALGEKRGAAIEEVTSIRDGAPLEVLRLVLVDGAMELRFCGARVRLGHVES